MKIFMLFHPSGNLSVPGNQIWLRNLYEPLVKMGHEIDLIRLDDFCLTRKVRFRSKQYREMLSDHIDNLFANSSHPKRYDLGFFYVNDMDVFPEVIDKISKLMPTVNMSCNNTHQFHLMKNVSKCFHFSLYSEKNAKSKFDSLGVKSVWFPMAANPDYYTKIKAINKKYDVSFVGSSYANRIEYIRFLLENGVNAHAFGPNWLINKPNIRLKQIYKSYKRVRDGVSSILAFDPNKRLILSSAIRYYDLHQYLRNKFLQNLHPPPSDADVIEIYGESKVNLGFLEVFLNENDTHLTRTQHIHLREFEIPMSGNFYMTNHNDELAEFYEPDKELVMFYNEYDLLEKIRFYLTNENARNKIASASQNRALNSHTYQIRFSDLFNYLKLV